jgi:hypothetical protein
VRRNWILAGGACVLLGGRLEAQTDLWSMRGTQPNSAFGSIASLGDVDGDGVDDFVVGDSGDFWNFSTEPGRAYVYSGADRSLLYEFVGDNPGDCFGFAVGNAGDVDGDGVNDVIVGAMQWIDWKATGLGYVRVFSGADGHVIRTHYGTQSNAAFGVVVSSAGDVDADGHADYLVDAQWETVNGVAYASAVHLYSGATGAELFTVGGKAYFDYVGYSLAPAGDVNGDGHDDFLVGSIGETTPAGIRAGVARLYSGKDFSVIYEIDGTVDGADMGTAVAGGHDLNGDGVPDFAVGAPAGDSLTGFDLGKVLVYSGKDGSLLQVHGGLAAWDVFGSALSMDADVDGDGTADLAVGAPFTTSDDGLIGAAYVFSGKTGNLLMSEYGKNTGVDPTFGSDFGWQLAGLRDLTGDGEDELIFSAATDVDPAGSTLGAIYLVSLEDYHATWRNYGDGWPGTHCCPSLTSNAAPVFGTTITLSLENSSGGDTVALLYGGFAKATIPTSAGGTILVALPWWTSLPLALPAAGLDLDVDVVAEPSLVGLEFDLQAIEVDPGATKHLSFTPGVELILGGD